LYAQCVDPLAWDGREREAMQHLVSLVVLVVPAAEHELPLFVRRFQPPAHATSRPGDPCYAAPLPSPATDLSCDGGASSLHVTATTDAKMIDMVSVEAYPENFTVGKPNVHMTLAAHEGKVDGWVSGLEPGTPYNLAVRAHRAGCAEDAGNGTWSQLVWLADSCRTLAGKEPRRVRPAPRAAGVATHWIEVFRMVEANRSLPDFLDNHDSGDMGGDGAVATLALGHGDGALFASGPITRYCVEVLNTTIPNTTTTTFAGAPVDAPYSDYRSTNPPWLLASTREKDLASLGEVTNGTEYASWCDLVEDRYLGHLSRTSLLAAKCDTHLLSPRFMACECSEQSTTASRYYTGMMPIGLPTFLIPLIPGWYPGSLPDPVGHWYSHPVGGRCPLGASVGTRGCTWQRAPLSHSIYPSELLGLGWDSTPAKHPLWPNAHQPIEQAQRNIAVFQKAWAAKGVKPCGHE